MDEVKKDPVTAPQTKELDIRSVVRNAIQEFITLEQSKAEPAYKVELLEERKRREQLEQRVNELVQENRRSRTVAEELDRAVTVRNELQRLGVNKVDLAFKAVKDDIVRTDDGRLVARTATGDLEVREYLAHFIGENPELLPARIAGGSGIGANPKPSAATSAIDIDKIRPGMSQDDLDRARQEISRVALQTVRG